MAKEDAKTGTFGVLNAVNVNGHTETKMGGGVKLTYLSWPWAWAEIMKYDPDAEFSVVKNPDGWDYHTDGKTCRVEVSLTIKGKTRTMSLPVMDFRNKSIPVEAVTSMDVNKAVMRCMVKAAALFGLGLYIYAGEDLPEEEAKAKDEEAKAKAEADEAHKLYVEAWGKFKSLPCNSDTKEREELVNRFVSVMKSVVGKVKTTDLTTEDWRKIISSFPKN